MRDQGLASVKAEGSVNHARALALSFNPKFSERLVVPVVPYLLCSFLNVHGSRIRLRV